MAQDNEPIVDEEKAPVVEEKATEELGQDGVMRPDSEAGNIPAAEDSSKSFDNAEDPVALDKAANPDLYGEKTSENINPDEVAPYSSPADQAVQILQNGRIVFHGKVYVDPIALADEYQYWVNRGETPSGSTGNLSAVSEVCGHLRMLDQI